MSAKQDSKEVLPAQHQTTQPGREAQMSPPPASFMEGYKASGQLRGKVALVTGGDSGIGRAVAIAFAKEGADVAIDRIPRGMRGCTANAPGDRSGR